MPTTDDGRAAHRADLVARLAALLVAVGGLVLVLAPVFASASSRRALFADPFAAGTDTKVVERIAADGTTSVERTTAPDDGAFFERSLAASGALLLRIGVVVAAAFLAGAVVQRTMLGHFALELGPIKVPDLPVAAAAAASRDGMKTLRDRVVKQERAIGETSGATFTALTNLQARMVNQEQLLNRTSAQVEEALMDLDARIRQLQRDPPAEGTGPSIAAPVVSAPPGGGKPALKRSAAQRPPKAAPKPRTGQ